MQNPSKDAENFLLEKKPSTPIQRDKVNIESLNDRSLTWENTEKIVYIFDYERATGRGEVINRHVLKRLKDKNQWNLVRHPLILNYINEKLLRCTLFYALQIIVYFVFLFLLYSYVLGPPTIRLNLAVTAILLLFIFFLLIKAALKLESGTKDLSFWFVSSYAFNLCTYLVTLFYVWSFYVFTFDNYNEETKRTLSWFLPIIAILSSWINCLYILRKSPCGVYILMMSKILYSFLKTTIIWIPTLFAFAFSFQLVMRDSGTEPWDDKGETNSSSILMVMFQSFTKTSAMMVGEVEANDILGRKAWVANLLLIAFEVITVILLMNLMISLAVGDVHELRANAEAEMLRIKLNFCIEALHLSEQITFLKDVGFRILHKIPTNNIMVIHKEEDVIYTKHEPDIKSYFQKENILPLDGKEEKVFEIVANTSGLKLRKMTSANEATLTSIQGCTFKLIEIPSSGIRLLSREEGFTIQEPKSGTVWTKLQQWLLGLNMKKYGIGHEK